MCIDLCCFYFEGVPQQDKSSTREANKALFVKNNRATQMFLDNYHVKDYPYIKKNLKFLAYIPTSNRLVFTEYRTDAFKMSSLIGTQTKTIKKLRSVFVLRMGYDTVFLGSKNNIYQMNPYGNNVTFIKQLDIESFILAVDIKHSLLYVGDFWAKKPIFWPNSL